MNLQIELDREDHGRWIAEVPDLPGALTYGTSRDDVIAHVQALALRVLADRLEHSETPALLSVTFKAALKLTGCGGHHISAELFPNFATLCRHNKT